MIKKFKMVVSDKQANPESTIGLKNQPKPNWMNAGLPVNATMAFFASWLHVG
jgi:hypothetical protein